MKLITLKGWDLQVAEEAWGISAFRDILERDKSKEKERAINELLYVYHYCDIRSDFSITPENEKEAVLKEQIKLPAKWKADKKVQAAIEVYKKFSETPIQRLYKQSLKSAQDIGNYLEMTDVLLAERDNNGKPVTDISKITASLQRIPKLMSDLKAAYKEVVQEQKDLEGKQKGSKTMNMFEDGIKL
jgi:hypothetical protein